MKSEAYTGFAPGKMIIDPADKFLEVADVGQGLGGISSFALDSSTGMLTPGVSGALTFVTSVGATDIALHPSGNFLFLSQGSTAANSGLMEFTVDRTTGLPTLLGSAPTPTGLSPEVIAGDRREDFFMWGMEATGRSPASQSMEAPDCCKSCRNLRIRSV
jgi:hypothetical protein